MTLNRFLRHKCVYLKELSALHRSTIFNAMKKLNIILVALAAIGFVACSGPRYASSTEYDDVYYSRSDQTTLPSAEAQDTYNDNTTRYQREPVESYNDTYYSDDDFYYSRRLRRFGTSSTSNWRYYDPYFSNDLYFVMGTPAWNAWNANGWYNWNQPRFGRPWNDPFFGAGFGFSPYFGSRFNMYSSWMNYGYYDPFVSNFYGYDPFFGPFGMNSFYGGFGAGFGNPYAGFGLGGFGGYYCPPTGFVPANAWRGWRSNVANNSVTRRRTSTQSTASQTGFTPNQGSPRNTVSTPRTASSNDYLSPRTRTSAATLPARSTRATGTMTNGRTTVPTRPSRSGTSVTRPSTRTTTSGSYSRPSTRTSRPSTTTAPRRTYTSPSRSTVPQRNYSSPSRTSPSRSYSSPSRSSSNSYSRPSSSPSRSYSSPSRSSSSSSSRSSSSSGSVRRR
jgi:hypothetical protein